MNRMLTIAACLTMAAAAPALAQNTKGTGAETTTSTTTNPGASTGQVTVPKQGFHADVPAGTNRPNKAATESAEQKLNKP